jgi:hypothetical protein
MCSSTWRSKYTTDSINFLKTARLAKVYAILYTDLIKAQNLIWDGLPCVGCLRKCVEIYSIATCGRFMLQLIWQRWVYRTDYCKGKTQDFFRPSLVRISVCLWHGIFHRFPRFLQPNSRIVSGFFLVCPPKFCHVLHSTSLICVLWQLLK